MPTTGEQVPAGAQQLAFSIWCRVVDNLGDAGVCWRLARQLAGGLGMPVDLWIDEPATLARIEPRAGPEACVDGVRIRLWRSDLACASIATAASLCPGRSAPETGTRTVLVSAFGCELPPALRQALAQDAPEPPDRRPLWVDLEYLSAEDWVEGCHGLASTRPDDGAVEHFFFPGFTQSTGGLLREPGLAETREQFLGTTNQGRQWLEALGLASQHGERLISLFCYPDAPLAAWLRLLADGAAPTRVLVPAGVADPEIEALLGRPLPVGESARAGALSLARFPLLAQNDYDRLLWCCDLNFVRGEDSWIRAHWADRPFVWQPYPQDADPRSAKLEAFLARFSACAGPVDQAGAMMRAWCGTDATPLAQAWSRFDCALPRLAGAYRRWASHLSAQSDLARRLVSFCQDRL